MTIDEATIRAQLDSLAKPPGSLGRLEDLAARLALTQGSLAPQTRPRRLVLFAGDHGVVAQGVTPWPQAVTAAMVRTILSGRATSSALARLHGVDLRVVDCGIAEPVGGDVPSCYSAAPIASGARDLSTCPAMTVEQFDAAWALGADQARAALAEGHRLLIAGEMGIGNTTPSACLVHLLAGADADTATGHGAGADDAMRQKKRAIVAEEAPQAMQCRGK